MESYDIRPLKTKDIKVTVPGSKSITNRALLMAALSQGECIINGILFSDDSRYFLKALEDLGFDIDGAVIKVDSFNLRKLLGETTKVPRWAVAYKYPPEQKATILKDIVIKL